MKRIATFLLLCLIGNLLVAQSPRLVLVEEFTGETCPPCAAANPPFNARLDANADKVISIKYQNDIPSAGPNYYAYNTVDVENRQTYYANTSSPSGIIDGNVYLGHPNNITEVRMVDRSAVLSPFTINVTHTFSANHDSIYTVTTVVATQAVNEANLKLRISVSERDLYGYTSANGESEYSHVMRKMLPDGNGIDLPDTWTVGQTEVINQNWLIKVPTSPVVDMPIWAMLEVISFVQNDTGKEILQTGHSPAVVTSDLALVQVNAEAISCANEVAPAITVENLEASPITSFDVEYTLDGGTPVTYAWTGNLAVDQTATATLPSSPLTPGSHTLNVKITNINGVPDLVSSNNEFAFTTGQPISVAAVAQNFLATTWPPANWINVNPDGAAGWTRSNTGLNGAGSAKIDFYNSLAGNVDMLYLVEALDLSTVTTGATLRFDVAHRQYSAAESDILELQVSNDCGQTWVSAFNKAGAALATATGFITTAFTPTATQWRAENVDLAPFLGTNQLLMRWRATSQYGNNAYIDNINTLITSSIDDLVDGAELNVYPNPANNQITLDFTTKATTDMGMVITNAMGQVVQQVAPYQLSVGNHKLQMPVSQLAQGLYFVTLQTVEGVLTSSFTISR
jgi:hypothetical protein